MAALKPGDRVTIVSRDVTPEDERSSLYYRYFGGLTGSVDRIYDDGSVCIDVDLDALSDDARDRHLAMQESERKRWLDGLSGEARNRLAPEQRELKLSYKILVSANDVVPIKGDKPKGGKNAEKTESAEDTPASDLKGPDGAPASDESIESERASKRVSEADLSAAEEEYLRSLQQKT